jgi:predicted  nucleic acid-binding Zn-ribbon protein
MPHQCVKCGIFYDDGASEILSGCKCGGRLFFFIRKDHVEEARKINVNLSSTEKKQIEKDVYDLIGAELEKDKPVVLDIESVRVLKPGKYELDLVQLFKKQPLIYKMGEGKYVIDLPESMKSGKKG